jgi:RNA polymerase sigma factor (sigma-70 family)
MADMNRTADGQDTTIELIALAKSGDSPAIDMLFRRCLPGLRTWACGRLPGYARELNDTQDLVQETLVRALRRLDAFDCRGRGAFQAYLRRAVMNRICDEIRRATRRRTQSELSDYPDPAPSPLEQAIGREVGERYRAALARLREADREAIEARLEGRRSYDEIAGVLDKPNANAARVAVSRAVDRLIVEMNNDPPRSLRIHRTRPLRRPSSNTARKRP